MVLGPGGKGPDHLRAAQGYERHGLGRLQVAGVALQGQIEDREYGNGVDYPDHADADRHVPVDDRLLRGSRRMFHDVGIALPAPGERRRAVADQIQPKAADTAHGIGKPISMALNMMGFPELQASRKYTNLRMWE